MSYRGQDVSSLQRPLIDLIPTYRDLEVEDEEEGFYASDDEYILDPKWRAMVQHSSNRIPRRIKRYCVIYLVLLIVTWISWRTHFGPKYAHYRQELREMDATPTASFGSNMRPHFKDMIQVKTMDEKHLPADDKRLVIVGDVHGCKYELEELLDKVHFKKGKDHLILTGDIVSKGPHSPGVVSLAEKLGASCVRGNHEDKLLLYIADKKAHHRGASDGTETSDLHAESAHGDDKLHKLAKQFTKEQIGWLKECPVILRVGHVPHIGEVAVVHAGLVAGVPLEKQDPFQCMNMRTIDLKTRMPSEGREGTNWEKLWNHYQKKLPAHERTTVVYGHDAKRGKNIEKYSKGLDSNCVRGGKLTALVIDAKGHEKYVQVKCKGYV